MKKLKYFKELDGVRGLAALMVMYFHFFSGVHSSDFVTSFLVKTAVFGQTGVILFFVLSGFLITRILLAAKSSASYFSHFYIKRSLRIFPLYYLALCIYIFAACLLKENTNSITSSALCFGLYLQNIAMTFKWNISGPVHFWSLAVEEHFYLFWPVVIYYVSARRLPFIIYSIIVCAIITRIILFYNGYEVFYFTGTTIDALAIGALLALKEKKSDLSIQSIKGYVVVTSITFLLMGIGWLFAGGKGLVIIQAFKGTFIAAMYYLLLLILLNVNNNSWIAKILNHKVLQYTGKISYGLYVYHVLCFFLYFKFVKTSNILLDFVSCFTLSYGLASLSYHLFEIRFLRLKDRFTQKSVSVKQKLQLQIAA